MSYGGYVLHVGTVEQGVVRKGDRCTCNVDYERRMLIAPNHTLTHVMNWALRRVLQTAVDQKGSLVDDQKLRFDFNNTKPVAPAQLAEMPMISSVLSAGKTAVTIGIRMPNVPQLVPEAKARMQATTKITAGSMLYSHSDAANIRL